eukprot:TRINITY_DN2157_c3_g1_i1.p1 TRINITY_DN2157_c3_g1~~TRINITY_DN2157_c3_g1_i1.p1  ORF type:complete len:531 (-),score=61.85 TRINITY_DN2157_c3_g1_i1:94-1686(-)
MMLQSLRCSIVSCSCYGPHSAVQDLQEELQSMDNFLDRVGGTPLAHKASSSQLHSLSFGLSSASGSTTEGSSGAPSSASSSSSSRADPQSQPPRMTRGSSLEIDLLTMLQSGRLLEAVRELEELTSTGTLPPSSVLPESVQEQVRRLAHLFEDTAEQLQRERGSDWTTERVSEDFEYSYRLGDGKFELVSNAEYSGCDIITGVAALCEVELCMGYKTNVFHAEALSDRCVADSVWRVHQRGTISRALEDNLAQVSCIDALDETLGSIVVCICPPDVEELQVKRGLSIPPPDEGSVRIAAGRTVCRLTPLNRRVPHAGFKMTMLIRADAPRALTVMPSFMVSSLVKKVASDSVNNFRTHVETCAGLRARIRSGARAEFYGELQRHLLGQPSPVKKRRPSTQTHSDAVRRADSEETLPMRRAASDAVRRMASCPVKSFADPCHFSSSFIGASRAAPDQEVRLTLPQSPLAKRREALRRGREVRSGGRCSAFAATSACSPGNKAPSRLLCHDLTWEVLAGTLPADWADGRDDF